MLDNYIYAFLDLPYLVHRPISVLSHDRKASRPDTFHPLNPQATV